ncbi:DUF975 family protein [Ruminococcus sp. RTP21358st1_A5_RTP21358_211008]|uniref:DUF975 family protein n=1 Tax=unclassified Ruminococcus TaxID=2608920 RepID=UPI0034A19712
MSAGRKNLYFFNCLLDGERFKGNKWAAFVLDLSFIGWSLLGIITFGLVNIFFAGPYQYLTQSQLYFRLKEQQKEESYGY